jgi:multidrug efflux pump subunit AcrA (membrane-fusion protein)
MIMTTTARLLPATLWRSEGRVDYLVHVVHGAEQRVVSHRFSAFLELHAKLRAPLGLPAFPVGKALVNTTGTVHQRISLLQRFLDDVLYRAAGSAAAAHLAVITEFLSRPALDAIGTVPFGFKNSAMAAAEEAATGRMTAAQVTAAQAAEAAETAVAASRTEVTERVAAAEQLVAAAEKAAAAAKAEARRARRAEAAAQTALSALQATDSANVTARPVEASGATPNLARSGSRMRGGARPCGRTMEMSAAADGSGGAPSSPSKPFEVMSSHVLDEATGETLSAARVVRGTTRLETLHIRIGVPLTNLTRNTRVSMKMGVVWLQVGKA